MTIAAYKADETNSPTVHVCASSDKKTHEEYITAAHTCKPAVSLLQFSAHLPLHLYDGLAAATANRRQGNLKNRPAIQDFQSCSGGEHHPRHTFHLSRGGLPQETKRGREENNSYQMCYETLGVNTVNLLSYRKPEQFPTIAFDFKHLADVPIM